LWRHFKKTILNISESGAFQVFVYLKINVQVSSLTKILNSKEEKNWKISISREFLIPFLHVC